VLTQLTVPIVIKSSPDISATLKRFTQKQNDISPKCFNKGKPLSALDLHKKTYKRINGLNAQMTCTVIRLTASAYVSAKRNKHPAKSPFRFKTNHALFLIGEKGRDASFTKDGKLSIWTIKGRKKVDYQIPEFAKSRFSSAVRYDSLNLIEKSGRLYGHLCISIDVPEPKGIFPVGIDRNVTNVIVAVDSDGRQFFKNGLSMKIKNIKLRKLRSRLARKLASKKADGANTHSVVRLFKRLGRKQHDRTQTFARTVAKELVSWCPKDSVLVLEDLNMPQPKRTSNYHLRSGTRRRLSGWFYNTLETAIRNKAAQVGMAVASVNPYNTSKICSRCGLIGVRNKHCFSCSSCGFSGHADTNAAFNIRNRFTALRSSGVESTTPEASSRGKPPALAGGS
jgi:IS605 OrfB family transposase